jgi:hypothetical protein
MVRREQILETGQLSMLDGEGDWSIPPVLEEDITENADYNSGVGEHSGGSKDGVPGFWMDDSRNFVEALE